MNTKRIKHALSSDIKDQILKKLNEGVTWKSFSSRFQRNNNCLTLQSDDGNIIAYFLPPNVIAAVQPMDQNLIKLTKLIYRS